MPLVSVDFRLSAVMDGLDLYPSLPIQVPAPPTPSLQLPLLLPSDSPKRRLLSLRFGYWSVPSAVPCTEPC